MVKELENRLEHAIAEFRSFMPSVFDPFAGGGAIPMEAARLGCNSFGNDINPVAHIIERSSVEFPQKYGKQILFSQSEFEKIYGKRGLKMAIEQEVPRLSGLWSIPNRLAWDVEYYAREILDNVEQKIGWMYPKDVKGRTPVAFYWARTAVCSNPSCGAEIPLLRTFDLVRSKSNQVSLLPKITRNKIEFELKKGASNLDGWNHRGVVKCPCCGSITSVEELKTQSCGNGLKLRLLACISDAGTAGKDYILPSQEQYDVANREYEVIGRPTEDMTRNSNGGDTFPWGFRKWADLFTDRQLFMLNSFVEEFNKFKSTRSASEYDKALITLLAVWIDRIARINNSFGIWNKIGEKIEGIMGRQAISMVFDFPESNPFCGLAGSALNQLDWLLRYFGSESSNPFWANVQNASSGDKDQFAEKSITATVTDPPYYDAIAYADCSDFFYVWLKRTLGDVYPLNFSTPQTPKSEECTALKYHHDGDESAAKIHFESSLTNIFDSIERQSSDIVSIMFAHQSTEAWTTLCNSILGARMNITGSWPMDSERSNAGFKVDKSYLESSVTVSCRPSQRKGFGDYRQVKKDIDRKVSEEVKSLYALGFRGADLLTACFGQAVSEFGKYKRVENAQGDEVTVAQLLDMTRTSAFNALLHGFEGDAETQFYIGWLQLNGTSDTDHDDATKFTRVGVNIEIKEVIAQQLLVKGENNKQHLASADEHLTGRKGAGLSASDPLIDQVHRAMLAYKASDRVALLKQIKECGQDKSNSFWRVISSLKELLPAGDDLLQVEGLLQNADSLIADSKKRIQKANVPELDLEF